MFFGVSLQGVPGYLCLSHLGVLVFWCLRDTGPSESIAEE